MEEGDVRVSVIVCVYTLQRWSDIVEGVAALGRQTRAPEEVLVVVDHNEELAELARTQLDGVRVVANDGARGLSGARNTGVRAATGDVLLFLDDDALPAADWVERVLEPFADPAVVGVGGWARPDWQAARPDWFPEAFLWVVGCSYEGLPGDSAEIRNPIGCNMAFRREAFDAAGLFSEGVGRVGKHPIGCEETELSIRVARALPGARILHSRGAVVHHRVPADRSTVDYFARRCFWEGFSKAGLSRVLGARDSLSSETGYVARTLTAAVAGSVREGVATRSAGPLRGAAAIVGGLAATAAGYGYGRLLPVTRRGSRAPEATAATPA